MGSISRASCSWAARCARGFPWVSVEGFLGCLGCLGPEPQSVPDPSDPVAGVLATGQAGQMSGSRPDRSS